MQLNIKSPEANTLARDLAEITGETLTEAVTKALSERLERERQARSREAKLERIRQIVEESGGAGEAPDVNELLYDERGLPA